MTHPFFGTYTVFLCALNWRVVIATIQIGSGLDSRISVIEKALYGSGKTVILALILSILYVMIAPLLEYTIHIYQNYIKMREFRRQIRDETNREVYKLYGTDLRNLFRQSGYLLQQVQSQFNDGSSILLVSNSLHPEQRPDFSAILNELKEFHGKYERYFPRSVPVFEHHIDSKDRQEFLWGTSWLPRFFKRKKENATP